MALLAAKPHGFGWQVREFWVESMALLGAKPHGFGWEMRAEGWMISPSRVRNSVDSTPTLRRVDSAASRSRLLYPQPVESATHSSRVGGAFESSRNFKNYNPWGNKNGADSSESTPEQP